MWQNMALFVLGFYVLIKGADILIDGASAIARKARVSEWLIGLTIVGIGTSIPEFSVTLFSSLSGETPIGLGAIIGSNTANILFILGVAALLYPLRLKEQWVRRDLPWNIAAVFAVTAAVSFFDGGTGVGISRIEGAALLALFAIWLLGAIKNGRNVQDEEMKSGRLIALPLSIVMILAGVIGVVFGGNWVVDSAAAIAGTLGLSQTFIGLTIVGLGTSFPELAVTFAAAWKKRVGMAVGNIVGSNIFDFLGILGLTAMIRPISFMEAMRFDIMVTVLAATALLAAVYIGERYTVKRWQGAILAFAYGAYILRIFLREGGV